jgi:hypothetical protein
VYDDNQRDKIMDETSENSESSVDIKVPTTKVIRSLTEKRKNYVRRMTQGIASKDVSACNVANSFDSLQKSLPSTASIISQFQRIIDSTSNSVEEKKSNSSKMFDAKLFKMLLLVGYDLVNRKAYIKSTFPKNEKSPPMIEQFIYPTDKNVCDIMTISNRDFTLILTDEYGNHVYGYCKQIVPEGFENCLPLTYCIMSNEKATGFYFNVLKEIEMRHGLPENQFSFMVKALQNQEFPARGKVLNVKLLDSPISIKFKSKNHMADESNNRPNQKFAKRLSLESPEWLRAESSSADVNSINRRLTDCARNKNDEIFIKRENDARLENIELSTLYDCMTSELLLMTFGTLLIERKVLLVSENISKISSCMMAFYTILYPFRWQHTIISIVPDQIIELIQAPFPFFAGVLKSSINLNTLEIEDGIVVDLDKKILLRKCGDESTLLPETLRKSLKLSLKIVDALDKGDKLINVFIAEAFLQFFVKLFASLDVKKYDKNRFIELNDDLSTKYFLEWFTDTIMFKEFLLKMKEHENYRQRDSYNSSGSYFDLFTTKVLEKSSTLSSSQQRKNIDMLMKSKKQEPKKNFKDRIKNFLSHHHH